MSKLRRRILLASAVFLFVAMLATPLIGTTIAIGPTNVPEDKNPSLLSEGIHTQIWLPSGVMNEWIESPVIGELKVTLKDAAKFQIISAVPLSMPADIGIYVSNDNQWFYFTQNDFATFLSMTGGNPAVADPYEAGIYIKTNLLG